MKVKELINRLQNLDPEKIIVIQKKYSEGVMFCNFILQDKGHIGFNGPIIQIAEQICFSDELEKNN